MGNETRDHISSRNSKHGGLGNVQAESDGSCAAKLTATRRSNINRLFRRPSYFDRACPSLSLQLWGAFGVQVAGIHPVPAKPPGPADRARSAPPAVEGTVSQSYTCDCAVIGTSYVAGRFVRLASPVAGVPADPARRVCVVGVRRETECHINERQSMYSDSRLSTPRTLTPDRNFVLPQSHCDVTSPSAGPREVNA